ncbi:hypothetical protein [Jannaschia helgolandensis]|uniref:Uncharacterized protein n=1 Tax=Jannaschia helgolandensis TaxID=188906 RepID=A0A1H7P2P4_9RHOB|nr:hypothetical protein [Jannaschia helgolandensis]SEL30082.1 hypothetical protein SAMN04488526_2397 [Jannaschia helgolandensis]
MAKNKDRVTAKFGKGYAAQLMAFNIQKQRIVDLCNVEFDEDLFDEAKDYSSWHRALAGKEVWEGIVDALHNLWGNQVSHPRKYLPHDGPPDDGLHDWMKQIATAPWWRDVLQVSASQSAFNAWFSGRPMGKAKVAEVKAAVDDWWARLMAAVERAEYASLARDMAWSKGSGRSARSIDSYFYTKVVEEDMAVTDARKLFVDMHEKSHRYHARPIDLADPQDPLIPMDTTDAGFYQRHFEKWFDQMHEAGYPNALPSIPPDFDAKPWFEVKRWGGAKNEECPKDLNEVLYGMWYRVKYQRFWNAEMRMVDQTHEIVEVSDDGEEWRAANEREVRGWDPGTELFFRGLHENGDGRSQHEREVDDLRGKIKRLRHTSQSAFKPEERVLAQAQLTEAEKRLGELRR